MQPAKLIGLVVVTVLVILISPLPRYQPTVLCEPGVDCPEPGWHLSPSLLQRLFLRGPSVDEAELERNKGVEIEAATTKNVARCAEIQGRSYRYGPVDERIIVSEHEARQQCRYNIEHGIIPARFGV